MPPRSAGGDGAILGVPSGAPVVGRAEDWSERPQLWEAVLMEHAKAGYIKMPARGAADYATEYDVESATEYMLHLTYPDLPAD